MRLEEYVTPKKDYKLISEAIFNDKSFLIDAGNVMKISQKGKKNLEIKKLLNKHHIQKEYREEVVEFIESKGYRNVDHAYDKNGLVIQIAKTNEPLDTYYLKVGPNTQLQDFKKAFKLMSAFRNKAKRNREKLYRGKALFIYSMAKKGASCEAIRDAVYLEFTSRIDEPNIRTTVTDMCNKLGILKKDRPILRSKKK